MLENAPDQALALLQKKDIPQFKKFDLLPHYYLTRGRALTQQSRWELAVQEFQNIPVESGLYGETVMETAWLFYKQRKYESARVFLDVVIGGYQTKGRESTSLKISTLQFFQSRYLKAYISLVEGRTEAAVQDFLELKSDFSRFQKDQEKNVDAVAVIGKVRQESKVWGDMNQVEKSMAGVLELISDWYGHDEAEKARRDLILQMSLMKEIARASEIQAAGVEGVKHHQGIVKLQSESWELFMKSINKTLIKVAKSFKALQLKTDVGRLEVIWLGRSQGARSVDEVVDNYGATIREFDDFLGL